MFILVVCRRFGVTHRLHLQDLRVSQSSSSFLAYLLVLPKGRLPSTKLHGVTSVGTRSAMTQNTAATTAPQRPGS
jgi:hypothetical protein